MFQKRSAGEKEAIKNRRRTERQRLVARTEAETLQLLFSFVAAADAKLSEREVAEYSSFMGECSTCSLVGSGRVGPSFTSPTIHEVVGQLRRYMSTCRPTVASRRKLLRALSRLAACDGVVNEDETLALNEVARLLQLSVTRDSTRDRRSRFSGRTSHAAEHMDKNTSGRGAKASRRNGDSPTNAPRCYAVLGCSEDDSDEIIKRAYRRLASLLHPDRCSATAASPEQIRVHQRDFQRLQEAYEEVKRLRAAGARRRHDKDGFE
jgi:DnaJ-domain-containing protein 1